MPDTELVETDIVEHSIDKGDAKPVKTFPAKVTIHPQERVGGGAKEADCSRMHRALSQSVCICFSTGT